MTIGSIWYSCSIHLFYYYVLCVRRNKAYIVNNRLPSLLLLVHSAICCLYGTTLYHNHEKSIKECVKSEVTVLIQES